MSTHTGLKKSQVSKILATLRDSGFLRQNPKTREYSVGLLSVALAGGYINSSRLAREGIALMRELVDTSGQTAVLSVLHDKEIMYLAAVEGPLFIDVGWRVGTWMPFHATAVGKVLVAYLDEAELDAMIASHGLPRLTPQTICDPDTFRAHLSKIRDTGIGETKSEGTRGLGAMAAPVFGEGENVIAALGFVYPAQIVDTQSHRHFSRFLHGAARRLSAKLGAQVYPYGALTESAC